VLPQEPLVTDFEIIPVFMEHDCLSSKKPIIEPEFNPYRILTTCFPKIHFSIILPTVTWSPKLPFTMKIFQPNCKLTVLNINYIGTSFLYRHHKKLYKNQLGSLQNLWKTWRQLYNRSKALALSQCNKVKVTVVCTLHKEWTEGSEW